MKARRPVREVQSSFHPTVQSAALLHAAYTQVVPIRAREVGRREEVREARRAAAARAAKRRGDR